MSASLRGDGQSLPARSQVYALASSRLSRRRRLLSDALGRLGLHLLARLGVVFLPAQAFGRGAQSPADALGLRLGAFRTGLRLGLRPRIEFAADELDLCDFS